jgi:hypothetical protein
MIKDFNSFNKINENQEQQNYMFFGNLKTIKRLVDELLEMDEAKVDQILSNGHNWATDHIATSKDDIEEVFNFLVGYQEEEKPVLGGPESSHTIHDRSASEEDNNVKGFEDFSL